MKKLTLVATIVASALTFSAQASELAINSVNASSTFSTYNAINLINGAGLTGNLHSGDWAKKWITNGTVTGWLVFDLGSSFNIASSSIWNYGDGCCSNNRSVKDLGISVSNDAINYSAVSNYTLSMPAGVPFAAESVGINQVGRYVKFDLNSNYGNNYTGLSEVKFFGSAVPEAETYAMMLLGLGVAGLFARRSAKK